MAETGHKRKLEIGNWQLRAGNW